MPSYDAIPLTSLPQAQAQAQNVPLSSLIGALLSDQQAATPVGYKGFIPFNPMAPGFSNPGGHAGVSVIEGQTAGARPAADNSNVGRSGFDLDTPAGRRALGQALMEGKRQYEATLPGAINKGAPVSMEDIAAPWQRGLQSVPSAQAMQTPPAASIKPAATIEEAFAQIRNENAGLTPAQRRAKFEAAQQAEQDRIDNMSDEERAAYYDKMDQALREGRKDDPESP